MKNKKLKQIKNNIKKQIKSFKPSKTFIAITSALVGISSTLLAQNIAQKSENKKYYLSSPKEDKKFHPPHLPHHHQHIFEDDFFGHSIFEEMHQMQREMDRAFARQQARMEKIFHEIPKNKNSITQKETKDQYIYNLVFSGYKKEDIKIEIKDQTLEISANKSQKQEHQHKSSNFYYSFYLPKYDKSTKPIIEKTKDSITITLQKLQ